MDTVANLRALFGSAWHEQALAITTRLGHTTNAGDPTNSLTPAFRGQLCFDTSNNDWYRSTGTTSASWALQSIGTLSAAELGFLDGVTAGTMTASKALVVDSNGQIDKIKSPVESVATTSTALTIYGHTVLNSTSSRNFLLPDPEAGLRKRISKKGGSTQTQYVTNQTTSSVKFRDTAGAETASTLTFNNDGDMIDLEGMSATQGGALVWAITNIQSASTSAPAKSS